LLIQIVPHHNAEILLSMKAVIDHPAFFAFPFTGVTVPKKKKNPGYPQRVPDPVTDWVLRDATGAVVERVQNWNLNTVYYANKHELRITVPADLAAKIAPGALLQMTAVTGAGLDYVCEVFDPKSPQFAALYPACTESMPSGGSKLKRRYGWV
jgi:hypothetical protein